MESLRPSDFSFCKRARSFSSLAAPGRHRDISQACRDCGGYAAVRHRNLCETYPPPSLRPMSGSTDPSFPLTCGHCARGDSLVGRSPLDLHSFSSCVFFLRVYDFAMYERGGPRRIYPYFMHYFLRGGLDVGWRIRSIPMELGWPQVGDARREPFAIPWNCVKSRTRLMP